MSVEINVNVLGAVTVSDENKEVVVNHGYHPNVAMFDRLRRGRTSLSAVPAPDNSAMTGAVS